MQIPFHKTHTTDDEINAAVTAIKSGWLTMGPTTVKFEDKFKEFVECDYSSPAKP
jgi:perosamine synthetase